ncbi:MULTISPECIES: polysaccharide pyruvyl transferase family protein [Alphaproteobacteria]|uniref:Polysaccharide pyruvyl transferase domain-containing protein n=2 Tax=Alphaproteobacteria TaxID=28211 RepID=A0A512HN50_9HYPH|nr:MULTISPECIES: polysaccharide pyruvyl transferase family protein [Alphaproteobacteria]GEO86871.1 hypothetical protein RNA01_38030 [Ciceribacter naphthalenivorans]GLR24015.1 hypothetical protein GCM10007920_38090 [Ciceribacter naphthalenivorans]GLT06871.1 hypothetical protein GCM10007926_38090 [Sphingomonas psychrolutea]
MDQRLAPSRAAGMLQLAARPRTPLELMDVLRSSSVILAHRLHACIAAYALGIPHVGFGWDQKVASFFRSVGREGYFADGPATTPTHVAFLLARAAESGIDEATQAAGLAAATDAVRMLADRLQASATMTGEPMSSGRLRQNNHAKMATRK